MVIKVFNWVMVRALTGRVAIYPRHATSLDNFYSLRQYIYDCYRVVSMYMHIYIVRGKK